MFSSLQSTTSAIIALKYLLLLQLFQYRIVTRKLKGTEACLMYLKRVCGHSISQVCYHQTHNIQLSQSTNLVNLLRLGKDMEGIDYSVHTCKIVSLIDMPPAEISVANRSCTVLFVEKTNSANGFGRSRMILIASSAPFTYTITTRDHISCRIFSKCREDPNLEPESKVPTLYSYNHMSKTYGFKWN